MAEHVAYEIDMLQNSAVLLSTGAFEAPEHRVMKNALLESALLHLRSIDDFLGLEAPVKADDVIALDFLPTWTPHPVMSRGDREDVNKRVQHLTTKRLKGKRQWALNLCHEAVLDCVGFLRQLEEEQPLRAVWFRELGVRWVDLEALPGGIEEVGS